MGRWLYYTVELYHDGQWFNIDQWYRTASGELKHCYLHAAPVQDVLASVYDELAMVKKRIRFFELAAETQEIICAEYPAFKRSSFDSWDFFIWGDLSDLEKLLQKPVEFEDDYFISKDMLKMMFFQIQKQVKTFQHTIPCRKDDWPPETPVRIIICE